MNKQIQEIKQVIESIAQCNDRVQIMNDCILCTEMLDALEPQETEKAIKKQIRRVLRMTFDSAKVYDSFEELMKQEANPLNSILNILFPPCLNHY